MAVMTVILFKLGINTLKNNGEGGTVGDRKNLRVPGALS